MKCNRSEIFKKAWKMGKNLNLTISEALKRAWADAKAPKEYELVIKDWFLKKNARTERQRFGMGGACTILKETEKAYLLECGDYTMWVPKSCTEMRETLASLAARGIRPVAAR